MSLLDPMPERDGGLPVFVAAPTPFGADGSIDLAALRRNIALWLEAGLDGVLVLGSTGEASHLTDDEAEAVVAAARSTVPAGRILIAGTGRPSTAMTVAFTARAAAAGADLALVLTPHYYRAEMTRDAFVRYYTAVAGESPMPVLLYSVPSFTGLALPGDAAVELSRHPRIAGMKDSSGDVAAIFDTIARGASGFQVFNGSPRSVYPALAAGAAGSVLAVAAVAPELAVLTHRAFAAGDTEVARDAALRLSRLASRLSPFGLGGLKAAMTVRGYSGGAPRAPLAFDDASLPQIEEALSEAGLGNTSPIAPVLHDL